MREVVTQLGQTTQGAGAHHGAFRQGREGFVLVLLVHHQGIGGIFPLGDAAQHQALGQVRGQILQAVDGDVRTVHQHLSLKLLGEQALVTDLGQGHIEDLVPLGGHRFDGDLQAVVGLSQLVTHPMGLDHGQLAATGSNTQLGTSHRNASRQQRAAESQPPSLGSEVPIPAKGPKVVISRRTNPKAGGPRCLQHRDRRGYGR